MVRTAAAVTCGVRAYFGVHAHERHGEREQRYELLPHDPKGSQIGDFAGSGLIRACVRRAPAVHLIAVKRCVS
jgi:hypothetical protein